METFFFIISVVFFLITGIYQDLYHLRENASQSQLSWSPCVISVAQMHSDTFVALLELWSFPNSEA